MGPADVEQGQFGFVAPDGEEPEIGGVADSGAAAVAGQEPGDRHHLPPLDRVVGAKNLDSSGAGHDPLPSVNRSTKGPEPKDTTSGQLAPARYRVRELVPFSGGPLMCACDEQKAHRPRPKPAPIQSDFGHGVSRLTPAKGDAM
jgi:hypothetical protein